MHLNESERKRLIAIIKTKNKKGVEIHEIQSVFTQK